MIDLDNLDRLYQGDERAQPSFAFNEAILAAWPELSSELRRHRAFIQEIEALRISIDGEEYRWSDSRTMLRCLRDLLSRKVVTTP